MRSRPTHSAAHRLATAASTMVVISQPWRRPGLPGPAGGGGVVPPLPGAGASGTPCGSAGMMPPRVHTEGLVRVHCQPSSTCTGTIK